MATTCLAGSTGLVGSQIFATLSKRPECKTLYAFSRKELPKSEKLKSITSSDSSSWAGQYPTGVDLYISALGTSRAQAGGFENQRKIDYDLNLELAKAAKAAGTKTFVLISSSGANSSSIAGYMKMKGELEDAVKALDFEHCLILRPGLLVGDRGDSRPPEFAMRKVANVMGAVSGGRLKDFWAQDADVVARAAVRVGLDAVEGKEKERCRVVGQSEIVRLGRTEWVE